MKNIELENVRQSLECLQNEQEAEYLILKNKLSDQVIEQQTKISELEQELCYKNERIRELEDGERKKGLYDGLNSKNDYEQLYYQQKMQYEELSKKLTKE